MTTEDVFLPIPQKLSILLAEDDKNDCLLFEEVLAELPVEFQLTIVPNGEKLLDLLNTKEATLPDVVFLDLNMPRKNGFAALGEIKRNNNLIQLPVIIFTSADQRDKVKQVYRDAAHYYIRKPANFADLKKAVYKALTLIVGKKIPPPGIKNFVITDEPKYSSDETQSLRRKAARKSR